MLKNFFLGAGQAGCAGNAVGLNLPGTAVPDPVLPDTGNLCPTADWNIPNRNGIAPCKTEVDYSVYRSPEVGLSWKLVQGMLDLNGTLECNWEWINTPPGTHVVCRCWFRSDSMIEEYDYGMMIGGDFYTDVDRVWQAQPMLSGVDLDTFTTGGAGGDAQLWDWIKYNNASWQMSELDIVVPATVFHHDDYGNDLPNGDDDIAGFIPWIAVNWRHGADPYIDAPMNAWFTDVYIGVS